MRKLLPTILLVASSWGSAQDVARAEFPSAQALWALLGSVSTIEVEVRSPEIRSIRFVSMYRGDAVVADSQRVDAKDNPVVELSAGALRQGVISPACEGVHVFLYHREVRDGGAGGFGSGMSQRCVSVEGVRGLTQRFGASPLNRPPEYHEEHPQGIPVGTWLMFGATNLFTAERGEADDGIEDSLVHYFLLSAEPITPPADRWELPAYETWREAYDAFGTP